MKPNIERKVERLFAKIERMVESGFLMLPGVHSDFLELPSAKRINYSFGCIRMVVAGDPEGGRSVLHRGDIELAKMGFYKSEIYALEHGFENEHATEEGQCSLYNSNEYRYVLIGAHIRAMYAESNGVVE